MSKCDPELRRVLELVRADKVFWTRKDGGSQEYKENVFWIKQGIKEGLIMFMPSRESACRKDYMLTRMGFAVLRD